MSHLAVPVGSAVERMPVPEFLRIEPLSTFDGWARNHNLIHSTRSPASVRRTYVSYLFLKNLPSPFWVSQTSFFVTWFSPFLSELAPLAIPLHSCSLSMHRSFSKLFQRMFFLGERDVHRALGLQECLDVNRQALIAVTERTAFVPSRLGMPYPNNPNQPKSTASAETAEDWQLIKPATYYGKDSDIAMGMKVVGIRAANPSKGLPLVPATILLFNAETGIVEATIAGTYVTVARTSAGPALAVQTFQPQAQHLVIFGAGAQSECHLEIMQVALKRTIPKITIVNRTRERAEALRDKLLAASSRSDSPQEIDVLLLSDESGIEAALSTADVVAATTNTTTPLWKDGSVLKKGCLITGIGSYTPDMQEIPVSAVDRCHVIVDTPEAMEVGDLKHLGGSLEAATHPVTLAGDAWKDPSLVGKDTDCIFYKAVGTAIQDVMTAKSVVERAKQLGIGQEVDMG